VCKCVLPPGVKCVLPPGVKCVLPPGVKCVLPPGVKRVLPPGVKCVLPPGVICVLPPGVKPVAVNEYIIDGVGVQRYAPADLPPEKNRYPLYRRLGGPQGRSGRVR
jgi:hypothetical protein